MWTGARYAGVRSTKLNLKSPSQGFFEFFFVRVEEIHDLGLVDDRTFVARILPLVSGGLLRFLGDCGRKGSVWVECKVGYWTSIEIG
jgi:hypothetical protein